MAEHDRGQPAPHRRAQSRDRRLRATHACTHPAYRDQQTKARIGKQRGAKVAQVDLARRLAEAIWHMLTRKQPFAAESVVDMSLAELRRGGLIVHAHNSEAEYEVSVACAEIPATEASR